MVSNLATEVRAVMLEAKVGTVKVAMEEATQVRPFSMYLFHF